MPRFTGHDLSCFRGGRLVFAGVSFELEDGDALILKGPNGSGKSTLLRLMAGLLNATQGDIRWSHGDGTIFDDPDHHNAHIHYLGHADAIKPVLTVRENVAFWARLRTKTPSVTSALAAFGISQLAEVPGQFLSAGQRRRVNLARVLAAPASLWLLDEPATALDADAVDILRDVIATHRAGGGMVVASTHQDLGLEDSTDLALDSFAAGAPDFV